MPLMPIVKSAEVSKTCPMSDLTVTVVVPVPSRAVSVSKVCQIVVVCIMMHKIIYICIYIYICILHLCTYITKVCLVVVSVVFSF